MSNLNFKLNANQSAEKQIDLLNSILDKISSLDNRISNIEKASRNNSFHCSATDLRTVIDKKASDISKTISNINLEPTTVSNLDDDSIKKLNANISSAFEQLKSHTSNLVLGVIFFISCWFIAFVWWFWDVPVQTEAVNNYAYQQTEKEKAAQNVQ